MAKSISPNLPRRRSRPRGQNAPAWMLVQVFAAGVGLCLLLLALAAFLLTHTPLPLHLVQPMACLAASAGAAVSGFLLAGKIGRQRFVCGLICGAFYALCLLAAAFLVHGVPSWTRSDAMLPLALLLGGTLGGALSAIKEAHGTTYATRCPCPDVLAAPASVASAAGPGKRGGQAALCALRLRLSVFAGLPARHLAGANRSLGVRQSAGGLLPV